jgi:hypothetical protein
MAQAKTLTAAELRRATDYIATRPHAARNRAMLLAISCTVFEGDFITCWQLNFRH